MRLSLHKGGMLPDNAGDKGRHVCRYAILPHAEAYGAKAVVQPAYMFTYAPIAQPGAFAADSLVTLTGGDNVIIEAVKPCEDTEKAYILRLYEATGDYANVTLHFGHPVKGLSLCNMLEEEQEALTGDTLSLKPFQIRTVKVKY